MTNYTCRACGRLFRHWLTGAAISCPMDQASLRFTARRRPSRGTRFGTTRLFPGSRQTSGGMCTGHPTLQCLRLRPWMQLDHLMPRLMCLSQMHHRLPSQGPCRPLTLRGESMRMRFRKRSIEPTRMGRLICGPPRKWRRAFRKAAQPSGGPGRPPESMCQTLRQGQGLSRAIPNPMQRQGPRSPLNRPSRLTKIRPSLQSPLRRSGSTQLRRV